MALPAALLKLPGMHTWQPTVDPANEPTPPAGQRWQATEELAPAAGLLVPAGHGEQDAAPLAELYVPTTHRRHEVEPLLKA
jgi:hypothetical protein